MEEYTRLENELILKYNADPDRIAIMGNSMGGFSAAGIFTSNKNIKTLIVFNGSCSWDTFNKIYDGDMTEKIERLLKRAGEKTPLST